MDLQFPYNSFTSFFLVAILLTLIQKWKRAKNLKPNKKLPSGPWKLPFIGSIHHFVRSDGSLPHHILRDLARKHGPLMHLKLGEASVIVVSSPGMAKEVMKNHDLAFANRPEGLAGEIVCYNYTDIASSPYGEYWRQMRKIFASDLLSAKNVQSLASIRGDEGSHLVASIRTLAGKPVNLTHEILSYTNSMLCRATFGGLCIDQNALVKEVREAANLAGGFNAADLFPSAFKVLGFLRNGLRSKFLKVQNQFDAICDDIIDQHMEKLRTTGKGSGEFGGYDLIDLMLRANESGDNQIPITKNNIKAIIFDIFSGGGDTTSMVVEWALSEMIKNPDGMAKAQSEIREAFKGKKTVDENGLQGLSYLKLVIKETLRLHPAFPLLLPRVCREDCEIGGYSISKKTKVIINFWAIGRSAEYWKDPDSFKPERFEYSRMDFVGNDFQYIPFGAGRRMCPGMSFGLANVELPLALLLYHFNWELPHGVNELDMTETIGITAPRKYNLHLVPTLCDASY